MITYVNTVFVSNVSSSNVVTALADCTKGKFIFWDIDANATISANTSRFKIGMGTGKTTNGVKEIKWSNIINVDDIKGWTAHTNAGDTEDTCYIDLSGATDLIGSDKLLSNAGKRIIIRLTFKDLPTRYRKWTESYEYITKDGDTVASIATNIANMINKEAKRARVIASVGEMNSTSASATATVDGKYYHADANWANPVTGANDPNASNNTICLTAMKYDDDESVDSINWYNKVRFNVNMYFTDPAAEGWESLNKHFIIGAKIDKVPGSTDPASAKLVRDREAQAMGYMGILNRGEGTWPVIKPAMETSLSNTYNSVTLEFENTYHTADDLFRKTKQTVEIYTTADASTIEAALSAIVPNKLDVPDAADITNGHKAAWSKVNGVVTLVDAGA